MDFPCAFSSQLPEVFPFLTKGSFTSSVVQLLEAQQPFFPSDLLSAGVRTHGSNLLRYADTLANGHVSIPSEFPW